MIKDLKELQTLLKLCRKQGVDEISLSGVSIKFGAMTAKKAAEAASSDSDDADEEIPTDALTPEQLLFFSVGGGEPPA